ncbi:MAG: cytochrome c maturation protein CcmE [Actinomycetota bacterium]|nr:cytochrome c maturation protein CcmE [Actinomycetota bacterium]
MDLSPRQTTTLATAPPPRRRNWRAFALLAVVLVAGIVVVTKFLTSAIDYYCNVDEVGRKSGCETGRRLRIQGTVEEGTVEKAGAVTNFVIAFNGTRMPVHYEGDPGGLFQECIPVVVHGIVDDQGVFEGDKLEVKHTNEYAAKNADRLDQARSAACSQPQA